MTSLYLLGMVTGIAAWVILRIVIPGLYTVNQNERALKTSFGRAERVSETPDTALTALLSDDEKDRYQYPQARVIPAGGPYFRWPWEKIYKVSIAVQTTPMAQDLEMPSANRNGTMLEAVTKDQLNTGLQGQIRYRVSERNLYAYFFGVKRPVVHVLGYFVSVLREKIANFTAPTEAGETADDPLSSMSRGVSINDLRKNQRLLNETMENECRRAEARYGIVFDASLITAIDPPAEVESALAAINTAHNEVSSNISVARAQADQTREQAKRAVEIQTLKAQAEVEPLKAVAEQLGRLKAEGNGALQLYLRNVRLGVVSRATRVLKETAR